MANVKATDLIDFTRASKGHALAKVSYGSELVTNGGFDTDSDWTKGTGWSISGGVASSSGSNNYAGLQQTPTLTVGKIYSVTFTISSYTSGSVKLGLGSATGISYSATGTYTETFTYVGPHASGSTVSIFPWGAFVGSVDNVSVKEVTFDQPDGTIQLFEHPNNIPRIEYDADGNLLGLLIEEARTNTIQYSEDFENSYWTKGGGFSIYGNNGIAPDGTRTATLLTDINDDDSYIIESNICSNGQTKSVWIRTVSGTATLNVLTHHDQLDGEVTVTEEWQRFERAVDISEPGGDDFFIFDTRSGTNTASDIYIWGAQLETGGFATSYIRSNFGSSTTRSSDVASIPTADFGFNHKEGTIFVEYQTATDEGVTRIAELESDANNRITLFQGGLGEAPKLFVNNGGVSQADYGTANVTVAGPNKVATAFKENDTALVLAGGAVATDTTVALPIVDTLLLGNSNAAGDLNGHIKSITYTPKRLSNAKLQELTS